MHKFLFTLFASALLGGSIAPSSRADDIQSASRLAFGPKDILFVADWKTSSVHALKLPEATTKPGQPFNVLDLDARLEHAVGQRINRIVDLAMRPGTGEAYVACLVGAEQKPAVVMLTADGTATRLDLEKTPATQAALDKPVEGDAAFWDKIPIRSFTVTDMQWHDGKLYVAGLSNVDFSSALRVLDYPFDGKQTLTSIGIYHTAHNEIETRAPIRAMTFTELGGKPYLVAAYTCTPLVTIPVAELKDGAHVEGKTIAELGYGNTPNGMLSYRLTQAGKTSDVIVVTNTERPADVVPIAEIAAANGKPGFSKPVAWGQIEGVTPQVLPLAGVFRIDNQDEQFFVAARRDLATGASQLVSITKAVGIRLSDFISEYNFPDYSYAKHGEFQLKNILPVQNMLKKQEGFPESRKD